jgi:penicillin-binding protein 2
MFPGHWIMMAIGQGMTATPIQVARFTALIANGKRLPQPHLCKPGMPGSEIDVSPEAILAVREGFRQVVHQRGGTANLELLKRVKAAGKTGTAETGRSRNGVPLNHAWFTCYAPYDSPKVVVTVVVEDVPHGVHGGVIAAPIAAEILKEALSRLEDEK